MFWLKVETEFYNLDLITKITYSTKTDKGLIAHVYYSGSSKPELLIGIDAARFLNAISQQEGCWAFSYGAEESKAIETLLASTDKSRLDESKHSEPKKTPKRK